MCTLATAPAQIIGSYLIGVALSRTGADGGSGWGDLIGAALGLLLGAGVGLASVILAAAMIMRRGVLGTALFCIAAVCSPLLVSLAVGVFHVGVFAAYTGYLWMSAQFVWWYTKEREETVTPDIPEKWR